MPLPKGIKVKPEATLAKPKGPLWKGPMDAGKMGGVTQSMLSRFLVCRERFRLHYLEGIRAVQKFDPKIEVGHMWHECEESLAKNMPWEQGLMAAGKKLIAKYPFDQEAVDHWYRWVKAVFPEYVKYWKEHPEVLKRTPLLQEAVFHVPYTLPSGRTVYLKGKYDSVDLIELPKATGVYLQENKTKGDLNQEKINRQLRFDLQTMFYLTSLQEGDALAIVNNQQVNYLVEKHGAASLIRGIRYNCIWRNCPIRRHKAKELKKGHVPEESKDHFYERLLNDYVRAEPYQWFMRWTVEVPTVDIQTFKTRCLNPILEQLCDWYDHVKDGIDIWGRYYVGPQSGGTGEETYYPHYMHPFGVYNVLNEGGGSDVDEYIYTGSMSGMKRVTTLFEELQ